MFTKAEIKLAPKVIEAIKKIAKTQNIEWEWEPKIGDLFLVGKEMGIVVDEDKVNPYTFKGKCVFPEEKKNLINIFYVHQVTPILHWKKLKKIIKDLGYNLQGRARQEKVMRMVVKLSENVHKKREG